MKVSRINNNLHNNIKFRENTASASMNNRDAGLMIQSQNAAVNFARDRYIAQIQYIDANSFKILYKYTRQEHTYTFSTNTIFFSV